MTDQQHCPTCRKPTPEGAVHTCSPVLNWKSIADAPKYTRLLCADLQEDGWFFWTVTDVPTEKISPRYGSSIYVTEDELIATISTNGHWKP